MSVSRVLGRLVLTAVLVCPAVPAGAVGLFTCVNAAGQQVCVVDTGTLTDFSPSQLCNASCPPCAGRCDGARYYPPQGGQWEQTWQGAPGIGDNNILVPGASPQEDARSIVREGLATQVPPPAGTPYPQPGTTYQQPGTPYPQPGTTYQQPGSAYPQPGTTYQQPGTAYPQPGTPYQQPGTYQQQPGTGY
ncbi:hypothetical protein DFW101_1115 [Solidesulfovibrio carbinoliphilus subsp. oakridgensis]|uniref:Uncharacterized protein n=1 Tax=Solidesulfovibrio carbinoliphilus subsp. oakridgensis TaxID=694327 RepID=G7Q7H3_9BACT|nr:hypothetical protein [Solidesulfovibrio carbinoliphilus]EHJ47126.1 hypothetical protein DFW101_1115 [Solidesulfovibrio carbinoliphilus subsp. oakridgensis]